MTIAPALLLTVLCAGAGPALTQGTEPSAVGPAAERQQGRSGLIIAADIEGRLAIYDGRQQRVVELDKPAGRELQLALDPGVYEARLTTREGTRRAGILISEGHQLRLGLSNFSDQATNRPPPTGALPAGYPAPPHYWHALDPRHRIELRFGGWGAVGTTITMIGTPRTRRRARSDWSTSTSSATIWVSGSGSPRSSAPAGTGKAWSMRGPRA